MINKDYLVDIPYLKEKYGEEIIGALKNKNNGSIKIVRGLISSEDIHPGQKWIGSEGNIVTVCKKEKDDIEIWVTYTWMNGNKQVYHDKSSFAFQCRYSLIIPSLNK